MWNRKVFIRIIEVLFCIACVIALRVTDDESRRVFHYLRNRSREWSLLNNVTWGTIGAALATATCGGYVIVTVGLLVAAATGELRGRITELFLLGLGVILFGVVGALSLASIDSVPEDLVDNAAVLGALCLLTALVFIVDLLMKIPGAKKKHDSTQTNGDKDFVKLPLATLNAEKETKSSGSNNNSIKSPAENSAASKGSVNTGFDQSESSSDQSTQKMYPRGDQPSSHAGDPDADEEDVEIVRNGHSNTSERGRSQDLFEVERNRKFQDVGKQLREYTQGFESTQNVSNAGAVRYRNAEDRNNARREYFEGETRPYERQSTDDSYFRNKDAYRRPVDEVDIPLFPTNLQQRDDRNEPIFAKIINPGVKIMRVDRDFGVSNIHQDDYRNSDSSQYDNVPTRMRRMSPGILKKNRDVSFNIPSPPKIFSSSNNRHRDDIERLEEAFTALQNSIGTQTNSGSQRDLNSPSSPNDPGYVKHTASNWPHDRKSKTPGSSPDHESK